jgi:uncharacterized membrane protein
VSTLSVLAVKNEQEAEQILGTLKTLQQQNFIKVDDAAIVTRKPDGKAKIKQAHDLVGAGALGGAFWGLLLGMLFFVPLLGAAIGAGIGAASGKMADLGISDDFIKQVSSQIQPGQAALFLLTREAVMDRVTDALKQYKFQLLRTSLSKEDEAKLRETLSLAHA